MTTKFRASLGVLLVVTACGDAEPLKTAGPPLFDLPSLAGASPSMVDSVLGPPTVVTPIERIPENMPGEFRDYEIAGAPGPVSVRFYRDKAVFFTVFLPEAQPTAEAALQRVGVNVSGAEPDTHVPLADWWRSQTLGGQTFVKVGALRELGAEESGYGMVQAEIPN